MKFLALVILMNLSVSDINKIAKVNALKRQAEEAMKNEDFVSAISSLTILTDSLGVLEDPVLLNLANAYFHQNDTTNAVQYYSRVLGSEDDMLRSRAHQQLGVINQQKNKMDEALNSFKFALKSDPSNEDARYNYELLKKMLNEQEQQQNNDEDIEPSEYAKKLKEQADALAGQNLFEQALNIMKIGLQEDKTVAAYNQFITKLGEVVESKE